VVNIDQPSWLILLQKGLLLRYFLLRTPLP